MREQPPKFKPKKYISANNMIIAVIACALLSTVLGFGAGYLGSKIGSNNASVTIQQSTGNSSSGSVKITDVSDIAEKCKPSVVEINTESISSSTYFGQSVSQGAGSGVILSEDGYIVTNNHVVENTTSLSVTLTTGESYDATIVGTDSQTDLAIIKIDAKSLSPATLGDSDTLKVGDPAIAIGNPLGELGGTVTTGIISATDRQITINDETMTLLQTDAAINPGNSGGGLFNSNGELIGIVNAKESSTGIEGLGFAIPISGAKDIITDLIENGSVTTRPALNVSLYDYSSNSNSSTYKDGCYIVQIIKGGAADEAGLKQNDRIVQFDGQEISSASQVKAILRNHKIGDKVKMTVERNNKEIEVEITLQKPTSSN